MTERSNVWPWVWALCAAVLLLVARPVLTGWPPAEAAPPERATLWIADSDKEVTAGGDILPAWRTTRSALGVGAFLEIGVAPVNTTTTGTLSLKVRNLDDTGETSFILNAGTNLTSGVGYTYTWGPISSELEYQFSYGLAGTLVFGVQEVRGR